MRIFSLIISLITLAFANVNCTYARNLDPTNTKTPAAQFGHTNTTGSSDSKLQSLALAAASNTTPPTQNQNIQLDTKNAYGTIEQQALPVFGSNLFNKQRGKLQQTRYFNPNYRISIGDQINLQMWGAYQFNAPLTVDTQGNIFIPEVGPVKIEGIANNQLNTVIANAIKTVFKKNVHSYADLVTAQPVQVYVTGYVKEPGLYNGLSSDSVIYYLCQASGIDPKQGSFRHITLLRDGKPIHHIDLYQFLINGNISQFQLHQGDTLVVGPLAHTINVLGDVKSPYQYEFTTPNIRMQNLVQIAGLNPSATYVRVQSNRGLHPNVSYLPIATAMKERIYPGDEVSFVSDQQAKQVLVTINGQVSGKHEFIVPKGTTLAQLVKRLTFTAEANEANLQLYRLSLAQQQKEAIDSSLARLQRQVMTASAATEQGAQIQQAQSELIMQFIQQAKNAQPKGQVVLGTESQWQQIILQNNDMINVPHRTSIITISGDVVSPMSMEIQPGYAVNDYVKSAGGYTDTADKDRVLVVNQNGRVQITKDYLFSHTKVVGGDQVIVLPKAFTQNLQITATVSQILYEIAVAAKVALTI